MREGLFELDYEDEDTYLLLRKEDIRQFRYYLYNNKKENGEWTREWAFSFTMADGCSYPVSRQTFLRVIVQAVDTVAYQKIVNRLGENDESNSEH